MKRLIFLLPLVFLACNPCRYVAKHEECFAPDTVKITRHTISYEKIYITEDSLIYDTIPCIEDEIVNVETVYKTIYKNRIDTIISNKEVTKMNPINSKLKTDNEKFVKKVARLKIFMWYAIGLTVLIIIIIIVKLQL